MTKKYRTIIALCIAGLCAASFMLHSSHVQKETSVQRIEQAGCMACHQ